MVLGTEYRILPELRGVAVTLPQALLAANRYSSTVCGVARSKHRSSSRGMASAPFAYGHIQLQRRRPHTSRCFTKIGLHSASVQVRLGQVARPYVLKRSGR